MPPTCAISSPLANELRALVRSSAKLRPVVMAMTTWLRCRYTVIRNCIPNALVIRITVANVGLPSCDKAL